MTTSAYADVPQARKSPKTSSEIVTSADSDSSSAYPVIGLSAQAEILTFAVGTSSQTAPISACDAAAETHVKSAKIHFFHSINFAVSFAPYRPQSLHL